MENKQSTSSQENQNLNDQQIKSDDFESQISRQDEIIRAPPSFRLPLLVFLILVASKIAIIVFLINDGLSQDGVNNIAQWAIDNPFKGFGYLSMLYIVGIPLTLPPLLLLLFGAYIFSQIFGLYQGMLVMFIYNFVFMHLTFVESFLIGRYMFRDFIYSRSIQSRFFFGLNRTVKKHGAYITFLLRSTFMVPYAVINYSLSVTDLSLKQYIIGNNGLILPSCVYIYIGAFAANLINIFKDKNSTLHKYESYLMAVGLVFLITVIAVISHYTNKELKKYIEEEEQQQANNNERKL